MKKHIVKHIVNKHIVKHIVSKVTDKCRTLFVLAGPCHYIGKALKSSESGVHFATPLKKLDFDEDD
jgi:hypothetical protein